jgi:hypothetical protein
MDRAERLRVLAEKIRNGEEVSWDAEFNAMALELAAIGEEFATEIGNRWKRDLDELEADLNTGTETGEWDGTN